MLNNQIVYNQTRHNHYTATLLLVKRELKKYSRKIQIGKAGHRRCAVCSVAFTRCRAYFLDPYERTGTPPIATLQNFIRYELPQEECFRWDRYLATPTEFNHFTTSACPLSDARDMGVRPALSRMSTSARPSFSSHCTASRCPLAAARNMGV